MKRKNGFTGIWHLVLLFVFFNAALAQETHEQFTISPKHVRVRQLTTITMTYTVGSSGMKEGGGLKVNLPKEWFKNHKSKYLGILNENDELLFPFDDRLPFDDGSRAYLIAKASSKNVRLEVSISTLGLDGEDDYINRAFIVKILKGELKAGDKIVLTFGAKNQVGQGVRAPYYASKNSVLWSVDETGDGKYDHVQTFQDLTVTAGRPYEMNVFLHSNGVINTPQRVRAVVLDDYFNPVPHYQNTVSITCTDPDALFPAEIVFSGNQSGSVEFPITFKTPGIHYVTLSDDLGIGQFSSNPVVCTEKAPEYQIFWGEMHSHDKMSNDGRGVMPFSYARDVSCLDFYAPSNHSKAMSDSEWETTKQWVKQFNDSAKFVTLLGFECSLSGENGGHNNVYYMDDDEPFFNAHQVKNVKKLYQNLEGKEAIVIPHHPAVDWAATNWALIEDEWCRLVEIYSNHGQSEEYDPMYPLSYEYIFVPGGGTSVTSKNWIRDAWAMGHKFGVIGSSDDHRAQPGREHAGLAAVFARSQSRDDIYEAMKNRRTFATTGARLVINFMVNGEMMGSEIITTSPPEIEVSVYGMDEIEFVELFKLDLATGVYETLYRKNPQKTYFQSSYTDNNYQDSAMYYVRVTESGMIRGRPVRGWSSPIWVKKR